jgi:mannose/fructose-specific phosphotransferase system component IIA
VTAVEERPVAGLIVTHARLAAALQEAAGTIAGDTTWLEVVSNDGASPEELEQRVRAALVRIGPGPAVVFTDLGGGSCAVACRTVLADLPQTRLVTGVNLPILVDFLLRRRDLGVDALVERLVQRGRSSIQELRGA